MNDSTDAIIFWGIPLGRSKPECMTREFDWEENYYKAVTGHYSQDYMAKIDVVEKSDCRIHIHGCDNDPMYYVCVESSVLVACRGEEIEINTDHFTVVGWERRLKAFCDALGIAWQEPKWFLVSYWG